LRPFDKWLSCEDYISLYLLEKVGVSPVGVAAQPPDPELASARLGAGVFCQVINSRQFHPGHCRFLPARHEKTAGLSVRGFAFFEMVWLKDQINMIFD